MSAMMPTTTTPKIGIACSGLGHVRRGVETWSQEAFDALREQGLHVTLFKGGGQNGAAHIEVLGCIKRYSRASKALTRILPPFSWRLGLGSPYEIEQTTFTLSLLASHARRLDLVHTKDPQVALLLQRAKRAGFSRAKVILNHGTEESPDFLKQLDYVQHLAPCHLEEAVQQGVRIRKHFMVPNFVDTDKFAPGLGSPVRAQLNIPPGAFVILCVAAIKRSHKRIDWLLREVSAVPADSATGPYLVVVGSRTPETVSLLRMGSELLGNRVRFLLDQPHEEMPSIYRAADLFVLCSLKEMFPNALLEAMASGVPSLASTFPSTKWIVDDGGECLDMAQDGALTKAIAKYRDPARRAEAGARARAHIAANFAKPAVIGQQVRMYEEVLSDGRA